MRQYLTFDATLHQVTYGVNYWSVKHNFLIQDISWNQYRNTNGTATTASLDTVGAVKLFTPRDYKPLIAV